MGAFIPAGNAFDAMAAIGSVLRTAKQGVFIVDPYMDEKALTDFAPLACLRINNGTSRHFVLLESDGQRNTVQADLLKLGWRRQRHCTIGLSS
jgi:hypothetical protein